MSDRDLPPDLDLKFLPDWLKEPAGANPYANYEGESSSSRGPRRDRDFDRGGRPRPKGHNNRDGRGRPGSTDRPNRPNRPERPNRPGGGPGPGRDNRERRFGKPPGKSARPTTSAPAPAETTPAPNIPLQVDFIPETEGIAALSQQIKANHRAYPLYSLGRMFLNKPERHRVRITSNAPAFPLYQIGENGPISLNRTHAEREAFRTLKSSYYCEETLQGEPPKGNYSNVARHRLTGILLGPTNHHGYQPALRRLYDARFSRQMNFNEFLRGIEIVTDPAAIEQWKKEASSSTVYRTLKEPEPLEFKSAAEVEAHFRSHYLENEVRGQRSVEIGGTASRSVRDRTLCEAIRAAWEKERGFPSQIVNQIRPHFVESGLHIWKHRKRILFVSTVRPVRFGQAAKDISAHIAGILRVIEASPKCSRADLSNELLKPHEAEPEFQKLKSGLAADLHWLIASGHVIEFHDGTLDLPLTPRDLGAETAAPAKETPPAGEETATETAPTVEAAPEQPEPTEPTEAVEPPATDPA